MVKIFYLLIHSMFNVYNLQYNMVFDKSTPLKNL